MGRKGSAEEYKSLIENIRAQDSEAAIRTTLMTGFPGETKQDFEELYRFVEETKLDHVGCFGYSDEKEAPSFSLDSKIKRSTVKQRKNRLMKLQKRIVEEKNTQRFGKAYAVAVDGKSETGVMVGHSMFQSPEVDGTVIWEEEAVPGTFVEIEITDHKGYDLVGRMIGP